ncbi:hypothetical protein CHCC20494_0672 [Bacillus licheniformis]|nr:hypothetical protein CHCC20494_0672 [Bacillus licheniformis]
MKGIGVFITRKIVIVNMMLVKRIKAVTLKHFVIMHTLFKKGFPLFYIKS